MGVRLPARDLDHALAHCAGLRDELAGARLLLAGGTGFIGRWLLETLLHANGRLGLGALVTVLTRDPAAFRVRAPHLAGDPAVCLVAGDVRTLELPGARFSHVIHAATDASARLNALEPLLMFDTIVTGTRRVLDCASAAGARALLFLSSGAVYGRQPPELDRVPEDYPGAPDPMDPASAYGAGKRAAELLCRLCAGPGLAVKVARCFAFIGPLLPLDAHYAAGNFIRDGLAGGPVRVAGDGTPVRSYLYAADLAAWLLTILARGRPGRPYNVGSETDITIAELARTVAAAFAPEPDVVVLKQAIRETPGERYVPSTDRAASELGLRQTVGLKEAIARTVAWHRQPAQNYDQAG